MCTVTFIPKGKNNFILTSNRDEAPSRVSSAPEIYTVKNTKVLFPKDELSNGTWIGISDKNRMVCVLNGGFELHKRQLPYRLSRGIIAVDFLISEHTETIIKDYNLVDVEPFTMVITDWNNALQLYELVWDGTQKHITKLPLEPKIWSSSTLYNDAMKTERLQWFKDFENEQVLNANSILKFHKTADNNDDYGVIMDRGFVKTTSITQIEKLENLLEMRYENLQSKINSVTKFNLLQTINE